MPVVYEYMISKNADNHIFEATCDLVEKIPNVVKAGDVLIDVDGSLVVFYKLDDKAINVFNDYYLGAVYIKSDVDLPGLLGDKFVYVV